MWLKNQNYIKGREHKSGSHYARRRSLPLASIQHGSEGAQYCTLTTPKFASRTKTHILSPVKILIDCRTQNTLRQVPQVNEFTKCLGGSNVVLGPSMESKSLTAIAIQKLPKN